MLKKSLNFIIITIQAHICRFDIIRDSRFGKENSTYSQQQAGFK